MPSNTTGQIILISQQWQYTYGCTLRGLNSDGGENICLQRQKPLRALKLSLLQSVRQCERKLHDLMEQGHFNYQIKTKDQNLNTNYHLCYHFIHSRFHIKSPVPVAIAKDSYYLLLTT